MAENGELSEQGSFRSRGWGDEGDEGEITNNHSQFPIPNSQFPIPHSQFPIPSNRRSDRGSVISDRPQLTPSHRNQL
ncbi:hypothetical protein I8748_33350 [Nostoc sp. CENA67]|uniref:Uncharacterized protein n=1 Tax=Amazonocrinis nigriterrae CENA67 TaxID=2794033 RepID=A0A8J7LBP5_9NOST|nr:hypothetical protein [Amazonocrinis nigriterrae]MBH8566978.1 hypothetical protein [Amazonocrinis nigriterrae CENA67]